jgi:hypothetical protein
VEISYQSMLRDRTRIIMIILIDADLISVNHDNQSY